MSEALECYYNRGDYEGGVKAIERFGRSSKLPSYDTLLLNLQRFYMQLTARNPLVVGEKLSILQKEFPKF